MRTRDLKFGLFRDDSCSLSDGRDRDFAGVPIQPCALDDAGLIGAAELAWQPVLDDPAILTR